ncbi:condensation domain protein [Mycobacterium xenopi 4042]|uniref:Condensation domain protein n=1 Tax=Mycobacterium xenopi 4042 TaxID=1299334 RepID=X7ZCV6_MYCXE|nr:condensation domain protein [Mycobacterium xenopi 4042]
MPVQIIPADPVAPWRYVELDGDGIDEQSSMFAPPNVLRCTTSPASRRFGRVDPHRGGPASVCADRHHIVMDGWSLRLCCGSCSPLLRAAAAGTRVVSQLYHLAGDRDLDAARTAWRAVFDGFETPRWWAARPLGPAARRASVKVPERITRAVSELARSQHTTVNTVLQAGFAQLLLLTASEMSPSAPRSRVGPPRWPARSRWWVC